VVVNKLNSLKDLEILITPKYGEMVFGMSVCLTVPPLALQLLNPFYSYLIISRYPTECEHHDFRNKDPLYGPPK
jgi:hypothetical protein